MKKEDNKNKKELNIQHILILSLLVTFLLNSMYDNFMRRSYINIPYTEFKQMLDDDKIEKVEFYAESYFIHLTPEAQAAMAEEEEDFGDNLFLYFLPQPKSKTYYTGKVGEEGLLEELQERGVMVDAPVTLRNPVMDFVGAWVLPLVFFYGMMMFITRSFMKKMGGRGGLMSIGESNAKIHMSKKTGITFRDVAGQEEAKESLQEIVDFLHNPEKYTAIGAKQPKGALLVGPPGTGKTLLAKAVAGEAHVAFFSISGSEFVEMFVGVGASRVRDLFKKAAEHSPCIIFIDEIDAIGKSRDGVMGGNDEREQTLNQLLAEMDGFDTSRGIVILAATNRPEILDKALLRPGRFDRRIIVEKPDVKGREGILKVHAKNVQVKEDVDFHAIALATSGLAGADLANMVNEAALRAVRMGRSQVEQEDLMEAVEVVIAGKEKKDRVLSGKEKEMVAYHEVGHALASALQKNAQPVQKITIVPRTMGALGYTMQVPEEEKYLMTKDEMLEQIVVLLAGRAAEEIQFQQSTTGAANDIERATAMARRMVAQFGMSEAFGMMGLETVQNRYLDGRNVANCSDQTSAQVDEEVKKLLQVCYEKAKELLTAHKKELAEIASYLLEKEIISGEEFMAFLQPDLETATDALKE